VAELTSPTIEARRAQVFPTLSADEIARVRRFSVPRRHADGEYLYQTGKPNPGLFVVLSGKVRVTGRDGHGHDLAVIEHGPGMFSGELGQLSGTRSLVDAVAIGEVQTLLVKPEQLRALLIAEALLGEKIMRALILRRVGLIETGTGGPVLIGSSTSGAVVALRSFLTRNGVPHLLLDPESDADAQAFVERYAPRTEDLPLAVCPDGSVLRNPTETLLAKCIGMLDPEEVDRVFDVAITGAGPAGLAAAVYAASEGLSVIMMDARAFGGQAGASARIENYFGFPTGIAGQALAARGYTQAQKFGAKMVIPAEVMRLDCAGSDSGGPFVLQLADGRSIRSRTVVVASGARYRRPDCSGLRAMEGYGVWYWASPIEARMCAGQEVVLVGGGNSAGQGAVFLSGHAAKVWMLIRGSGLEESMSKYLIDRIASIANVELHARSEIVDVTGTPKSGIESVTWRNRDTDARVTRSVHHVFLFLGADPATGWLRDCPVTLDDKGFVTTGHAASSLESSVPGVFAIGDVRSGSVKRVGGAIGEGAAAVAQIHSFLAQRATVMIVARG
jgi:thioredoxin reductase (NADPH)